MLSLYEILKASKTGIAPDMWTALAGKNWGGAGSGAEVKELTAIPPLSIRSNGTMLLDYLISGNMSRTGTPTPTTPIQPSECGDLETVGVKAGQYKIPISSANTTTPVYLGEVETMRKIKKLALTGEEAWQLWNGNYYSSVIDRKGAIGTIFCTHFISSSQQGISYNNRSTSGLKIASIAVPFVSDLSGLKEWLAAQYAAGTPVTIWYILTEPETGIVNEPLRKIGDYTDTLSMEQAGVQIPTNKGNTVIDVETELKPSEMYIKYQE